MENASEIGYFDKVLVFDVETSGLFRSTGNPCIDYKTGKYYQIVSAGLIIADTQTLTPVDKLYLEIKWDGQSLWEKNAEKQHRLTKDYLEKNGMRDDEALAEIVSFVSTYWDINAEYSKDRIVHCLGHNASSFDIWFMRQLFDKYEVPMFPVSNQFIDTNTIGWITMGHYSSNKLFEKMGFKREDGHNALQDAELSLEAARRVRTICDVVGFEKLFVDSF